MYHNLHGLVLRSDVSSEADKRITLYTAEWGKISAVVPGAKKIKAKLSAACEPVMESEFTVYVKSPSVRPKVTGVRILYHFPELRLDWRKFIVAQCCAEISDTLTPYYAENEQKYELLARTWKLLEHAANPRRILTAFTMRFLRLSGYSFTEYLKREHSFIPAGEKNVINQLATLSGEDVDRNLAIEPAMEKDICNHLDGYLDQYLPRPLATRKFWKQIEAI